MTTFNTGNPLGSTDVYDRYDNSENLDNFSNGQLDAYPDRFGVSRQSLQGIRNASQYVILGAYAAGLNFTAQNQVFSYLGEFYAPGPSIVFPYTTTGVGAAEIANFRPVGDAILRADLASTSAAKGSSLVGFLPPGAGAVGRTADSKLRESVSVKDFGAVGDCTGTGVGTDDLAAFNACIAYANANGYDVHIPPGRYRISGGITINNAGQSGGGYKDFRCNIVGAGHRSAQLWPDNGAFIVVSVIGSLTGFDTASSSFQTIKGFGIIKGDLLGIGLYYKGLSHIRTEDVVVQNCLYGHYADDCLTSLYSNVSILFNVYGAYFGRLNWTHPNAISFYNCTIGNNFNWALDVRNATGFTYVGGSIESNGQAGSDANKWGARFLNDSAAAEGVYSAIFNGTYFENNVGLSGGVLGGADVSVINSGSDGSAVFLGCNFARHPSGLNLNNIRYETSGGFKNNLTVLGCGFKGFNGYVPSAATPYIGVGDPADNIQVTAIGNTYVSAVESPNLSRPYIVPQALSSAWCRFNGATAVIQQSHNVLSVVRNSVGNYTITFNRKLSSATNCWAIATVGALGVGYITAETDSSVTVATYTIGGIATDFQVSISANGGMVIA